MNGLDAGWLVAQNEMNTSSSCESFSAAQFFHCDLLQIPWLKLKVSHQLEGSGGTARYWLSGQDLSLQILQMIVG